jgi:hypothetical protein
LLILGGYGESNSTESPPRRIDEYANNDTWFDDASDGSVKARITFRDGTFVDADPAWVLVGPPDFAPGIGNVVTLHDTLWDTAVREIALPVALSTPALVLLSEHKAAWQASGGTTNPNYHRQLQDLAFLATVSGPQAQQAAILRQYVLDYMRDPDDTTVQWKKMPRGLGDEYAALDDDAPTPRSFLSLTRIQYSMLREWAAGNFVSDWPGTEPTAATQENPSPDDLDRAATENSVGGPFFPGIDVSWLIRTSSIFSEPFRLKLPREPEGTSPTSPLVVGALELGPGVFSQQMALPWQADFYDCHRERQEDPDGNEYYFMWWTAHRPDDVFPSGKTTQERWVREFDKKAASGVDPDSLDNLERFNQMQTRWPELKFVVVKNGDRYEEEP